MVGQGEEALKVVMVVRGRVEVEHRAFTGKVTKVATLGAWNLIGDDEALACGTYKHTVTCGEETELAVIDAGAQNLMLPKPECFQTLMLPDPNASKP